MSNSAAPITSAPSRRRGSDQAGSNTCVASHERQHARRGRSDRTPSSIRTSRSRACPQAVSRPPQPGQHSRPAARSGSTTDGSTVTANTNARCLTHRSRQPLTARHRREGGTRVGTSTTPRRPTCERHHNDDQPSTAVASGLATPFPQSTEPHTGSSPRRCRPRYQRSATRHHPAWRRTPPPSPSSVSLNTSACVAGAPDGCRGPDSPCLLSLGGHGLGIGSLTSQIWPVSDPGSLASRLSADARGVISVPELSMVVKRSWSDGPICSRGCSRM